MNKQIRKLANQTVYYGISSIAGRILNFFLVPLYVRVFTEGDYGIYTNLFAYFTFLNIIYTFGMETTYFRFVNKEPHPRRVFSTITAALMFSTLLFSVIMLACRNIFSTAMGYGGHPEYITWILVILALDTLAVSSFAHLRYQERPVKFATIKVANILINIFFNIFFLVICPWILANENLQALWPFIDKIYNPETGIGYIFISNIIASAITLLMLAKELLWFNFVFDLKLFRRMIGYSAPLLVVGLAGMINDNLDRTILKHLLPYSPGQNDILLGIYGANAKLAVFMVLVIQAFRYAAEPFFFLQSKQADAKKTYSDVMKYFVIAGLLIFLFVNLYIDVFKYFVGREGSLYHTGLDLVPILLMANLLLGIYYNLSIWYKLEDKTKMGAWISLVGAAITIILNFSLIPVYGFYSSAWAKLACYFVMIVISWYLGQRYYPVNYQLKTMGSYFLLALATYFLYRLIHPYLAGSSLVLNLIIATLLFLCFTAYCLYRERHLLYAILNKNPGKVV